MEDVPEKPKAPRMIAPLPVLDIAPAKNAAPVPKRGPLARTFDLLPTWVWILVATFVVVTAAAVLVISFVRFD